MIREYIINACMLIAFTSIIYHIFINVGFSMKSPLRVRLCVGCIFGLLSLLLMEFSIQLPGQILIDFRYLALIMAALNSGIYSALLVGVMTTIGRFLLFDLSISSYVTIPNVVFITLIVGIVSYSHIKKWQKWFISVLAVLVSNSISLAFLVLEPSLKKASILSYALGFSVVSVLMFFYCSYLDRITLAYRRSRVESREDYLTGLNNVRSFDQFYNHALDQALSSQLSISLLYIDIDFFKQVNDTYGHIEGNTVLSQLGELLANSTRGADVVSRNGGEEFSVIMTNCDAMLAIEIAERIRKTVEAAPIQLLNGKVIQITVSIGVACFPNPLKDYTLLLEKADSALYEAKQKGRNRVVLAR